MLNFISRSNLSIFLSFLFFSFFLRFGTLLPTVIDPDESTYLVMAHQILHGDTLYVDTIDIKPFGIYVFFTGLISVFQSVVFVRLVAILLLALSAFGLYRIKSVFTDNNYLKFMVGLTYIALMSTPFGFAFNTEILFTSCTIGGLYFFVIKKGALSTFVSGLFFGLGFMTKYLVVFDILPIFLFFFIYRVYVKKEFTFFRYVLSSFIAFTGFLIPFWGAHVYYYWIGHYKEFHFITYVLPFNYQGEKDVFADLDFMLGIHQRYIPFIIVFYLNLLNVWSTNKNHLWEKLFIVLWYVAVLYAIYMPGAHFRHYYLQAIPVVSLLVPTIFFENEWVKNVFEEKWLRVVSLSALGLVGIVYSGYWTINYWNKEDSAKEIFSYLKDKISEEDEIYVSNPQIIHLLLNKKSPTRYVHPTLIIDSERVEKFKIDVPSECNHLFKENPPKYWVRGEYEACDQLGWNKKYELETKLSDGVRVFRSTN